MGAKTKITLLLAVILIAAFFRFFQISHMPGGLFPDEAANGLDINLMQQGNLQPFYERGNGREALFFYMLWGSVELFGKGAWQHHVVSAGVGLLAVIFCYLVTRQLLRVGENGDPESEKRAEIVALLAAFLMAVSTWHIVLSRTAFRANLIPLFVGMTIYLLLKTFFAGRRGEKMLWAFLFGASFALGFYSYIAYRILVPILGMVILWPLLASLKEKTFRAEIKKYFWPAVSCAVAFVIFIYPLARYFYTHPDAFVGRSGQVSVFNPELNQGNLPGAVWEVTRLSVLGYFTEGDLNWRHNVSGTPFLSPVISPFFGAALGVITVLAVWYFFGPAKRKKYWKYFLLTGWFWGMLLPVVTTAEGIPHGLRAIGTIPPVFIFSALGLYYVSRTAYRLHERLHARRYPSFGYAWKHHLPGWGSAAVKGGFWLVVIAFSAGLTAQAYAYYFVAAANSPEYYYSFRSDLTTVADYLKKRCKKEQTYLVLDKFSVQTTDYITSDRHGNFSDACSVPYRQVDPEDSWKLEGLQRDDEVVFTESSIYDIKKFKLYHPEARLVYEARNKFGQAIVAVYAIER